MPALILGKGKLSREDSWGESREAGLEPGRKEECWWEAEGGVFAPVRLFCQGVGLLHTISHVSMEELSRTLILLASTTPSHCYCRLSSEKGYL